jgi:hypothetical protein
MNLPSPPPKYDVLDQAQVRRTVDEADTMNIKTNSVQDKFRMRDTATGEIVTVVVTSGVFVIS